MLGFRSRPSSITRWVYNWVNTVCRIASVARAALLQGMPAVHQHFRFDDGNQAGLLAQRGIAGQGVRVGLKTPLAGEGRRPP